MDGPSLSAGGRRGGTPMVGQVTWQVLDYKTGKVEGWPSGKMGNQTARWPAWQSPATALYGHAGPRTAFAPRSDAGRKGQRDNGISLLTPSPTAAKSMTSELQGWLRQVVADLLPEAHDGSSTRRGGQYRCLVWRISGMVNGLQARASPAWKAQIRQIHPAIKLRLSRLGSNWPTGGERARRRGHSTPDALQAFRATRFRTSDLKKCCACADALARTAAMPFVCGHLRNRTGRSAVPP